LWCNNRLTSHGREVVSKFYREIGVEPPANIAAALGSPATTNTSSPIPSSTPTRVAPSSSPATPTNERKHATIDNNTHPSNGHSMEGRVGGSGSGMAIPTTPTPLPHIRPVDPSSPAPSTPRAAHHPLVREVRGQQDEADKSILLCSLPCYVMSTKLNFMMHTSIELAELENQVLRLLAAKASAPLVCCQYFHMTLLTMTANDDMS
jgi:hypothetical protein